LLDALGVVTEEPNGNVSVTLGSETDVLRPPREKDVDKATIVDLRRMLANAGVGPVSRDDGAERSLSVAVTKGTITYADAPTGRVVADNGIEYAYRDLGDGDVPLVLLQHFRGNLDNWDPALIDALAARRRVITFDNVGVAATTGRTPNRIARMAHDAAAFLEAMDCQRVDLLGFSIGSFVAQEIALVRPDLLRRVALASSAPQGAAGMHGWAPEVIGAVGAPEPSPEGYLSVFFTPTETGREAGRQAAARIFGGRATDRDGPTTWQTRQAQYDAVCAWGIPNHSLLERVGAIDLPVFVANGDSDPMILPRYSHLLAGLLPDARLTIYPDAAHGFLFQYHERFAEDVHAFLDEPD
jgi:pimeloyl-ACP methyl ester carboxylesterase